MISRCGAKKTLLRSLHRSDRCENRISRKKRKPTMIPT